MKRSLTLLLTALLVASISSGCKPKTEEKAAEPAAEETAKAPIEEEAAEEEEEEPEVEEDETEEEEVEEEKVEVDEALYIKAAFEVSCVKAKIENPEEQKEILEKIYPRYGFESVEKFAAAEIALKDSSSVKAAIDNKMNDCTDELAKSFKEAGASDEVKKEAEEEKKEEKQEEKKKKAPAPKFKDGHYTGSFVAGDIQSGKIDCDVFKSKITCRAVGKAEGKVFSVPASGKVEASGRFNIQGGGDKDAVHLQGELSNSGASAKLTLKAHARDYNGSWKGSFR